MNVVRTRRYLRDLKRIGASELEARSLELAIASDPMVGSVVPGLKGIRKVRFAVRGKGKRGGGRAMYFLMVSEDAAVMLLAFTKSEQSDLTPDQRNAVLAMLKELEDG